MKTLILLLTMTFTLSTFATKGGGGGNFEYMRSLDSLKEKDIDKILEENGSDFIEEVIRPSILPLFFEAIIPNLKYKDLTQKRAPILQQQLRDIMTELSEKYTYGELETKIVKTQILDCSCVDIVEDEYQVSHFCHKKVGNEDKICVDKKVIFDSKNLISINYDELFSMIWHELAHALEVGKVEHLKGMPIYQTMKRLSQDNQSFSYKKSKVRFSYYNSDGLVDRCKFYKESAIFSDKSLTLKKTQPEDCMEQALSLLEDNRNVLLTERFSFVVFGERIKFKNTDHELNQGKCYVNIKEEFINYINDEFMGFNLAISKFDGFKNTIEKKKKHLLFSSKYDTLVLSTNDFNSCYQLSKLNHWKYGNLFYVRKFENGLIKVKF